MNQQSKLESILEAAVSTATGFAMSWATWVYVAGPLLDIPTPPAQALALTTLFTAVSLVRQYIWRRFFNAGLHRAIQRAVLRLR